MTIDPIIGALLPIIFGVLGFVFVSLIARLRRSDDYIFKEMDQFNDELRRLSDSLEPQDVEITESDLSKIIEITSRADKASSRQINYINEKRSFLLDARRKTDEAIEAFNSVEEKIRSNLNSAKHLQSVAKQKLESIRDG